MFVVATDVRIPRRSLQSRRKAGITPPAKAGFGPQGALIPFSSLTSAVPTRFGYAVRPKGKTSLPFSLG